jgi:hypothetical protein
MEPIHLAPERLHVRPVLNRETRISTQGTVLLRSWLCVQAAPGLRQNALRAEPMRCPMANRLDLDLIAAFGCYPAACMC